jgi:hypothetical protein
VFSSTGVDDDEYETTNGDYPSTKLDPGNYMFLITNDIRYLETTYSITVGVSITDWRFVAETVEDSLDFDLVTEGVGESIDFGSLAA